MKRRFCGHRAECECPTEPGLHRIGPEPWDFVYIPAKDQKIAFVGLDATVRTGTVASAEIDDETGQIILTCEAFDDAGDAS